MKDSIWKIFLTYLFVLFLLFVYGNASAQITVKQFNAEWNSNNNVDWIHKLTDVKSISYIDIGKNT